jgi:enamine deaminase RidA (YjgF/YER057c/UK114 family)
MTTGGPTVYLAGVGGVPRGVETDAAESSSFTTQVRRAFDQMSEAVEAAGGTLADIVSMTVYLTDARFGDAFVRLRSEYFEDGHYPASAMVTVAGLARPEILVEIQAMAILE